MSNTFNFYRPICKLVGAILTLVFATLFYSDLAYSETANLTSSRPTSSNVTTSELVTIPNVDVQKFLGRWYQIARNPLPFEPLDCVCAQQTLSLNNQGDIDVYNSCNVGSTDGPLQDISGVAYSQNSVTNSKFTVDFGLPVSGQYWVIAVASDYAWAVVSDPTKRSLYILSKTPQLKLQSYTKALAEASRQISLEKLKVTDHDGCIYP